MKRSATARWSGNLQEGQGELDSQSGALSALPYTFKGRFVEFTTSAAPRVGFPYVFDFKFGAGVATRVECRRTSGPAQAPRPHIKLNRPARHQGGGSRAGPMLACKLFPVMQFLPRPATPAACARRRKSVLHTGSVQMACHLQTRRMAAMRGIERREEAR